MTQISKYGTQRTPPATPRQAASRRETIDDRLDPSVFKALSDPTRASLFACIAKCGRPCTVSEVAECCSVDLSVVSRHLTALAQAGLLEATKEGRTVSYAVRFADVASSLRSLADALDQCCVRGEGGRCGC
jgi:ArsR family transcriptional regulator